MPLSRSFCIIFFALALAVVDVNGQTAPVNELDPKYTPNSTSPFSRQRNKRGQYEETEVTIKNAIKFCPTMLIRQKAAFFYERKIIEGFSINVGIGKAFGPDFIQNNYFTSYKAQNPSTTRITPTELLNNG